MSAVDPRLAAAGRLITENQLLLDEADVKRDEFASCLWRPWRWGQLFRLHDETMDLIARIEKNSDRIDLLQDEVEEIQGSGLT